MAEDAAQHGKQQRGGEKADHRRSIDRVRVLLVLVGKAEEPRLHTIGEYHQQERRPRIEVGDNTVIRLLRQHIGVQRHQQPVEELADNGRETVDNGVFRQTFHCGTRPCDLFFMPIFSTFLSPVCTRKVKRGTNSCPSLQIEHLFLHNRAKSYEMDISQKPVGFCICEI